LLVDRTEPTYRRGGSGLNLNTATLEQLDTLSGIGPLTAQKILDFREERGGFGSVEELGEIPGIGDKRLATLREEVTL
jgi:competence protein ComEA